MHQWWRGRGSIVLASALVLFWASALPAGATHESPSEPNDPLFPADTPEGDLGQWGLRQVHVEEAWHRSTGDGVVIAIVDSGIDMGHEDLAVGGKVLQGATFLDCGPDPCGNGDWRSGPTGDSEDCGDLGTDPCAEPHGTHVAGIAAAATGNGIGVAGVAPDAELLPVKVLDTDGGFADDIARGVRWAAAHGADVINLSLGFRPGSQGLSQPPTPDLIGTQEIAAAIAEARADGAVVVAAAGNDSFPICDDPAFSSEAICVTATDSKELRAEYSNDPIKPGLRAVAAPGGGLADFTLACGGGVVSTLPAGTGDPDIAAVCDYPSNLAYGEEIGTSMAAPHVAGTAALLRAMGCSGQRTEDLILSTARDPVTGERGTFTPTYGFGIVDAEAAVNDAAQICNSPPHAVDDAATTVKGKAVSIPVLANDSDPDGDQLSIASASQPSHGTVTINASRTAVLYAPAAGYVGADSFTYTVSDGRGGTDTAAVAITVKPRGTKSKVTRGSRTG